jgi:hypothetical protein
MERLSTSPSKPPMTEIEELRARVEALEATHHAHVDTSRLSETVRVRIQQELSWPAAWQPLKVATETTYGTAPIVAPSPAGSMVERVADAIAAQATSAGIVSDRPARAAILEVAAWFRTERDSPETAAALEQEANR